MSLWKNGDECLTKILSAWRQMTNGLSVQCLSCHQALQAGVVTVVRPEHLEFRGAEYCLGIFMAFK